MQRALFDVFGGRFLLCFSSLFCALNSHPKQRGKKPSCNFAEPCEVLFKGPKGRVVSWMLSFASSFKQFSSTDNMSLEKLDACCGGGQQNEVVQVTLT